MIIAATGHRPDKLGGYGDEVFERLVSFARVHLRARRPAKVISGMALGWDQAVAQACVDLAIPFIAAVPFDTQALKWPEPAHRRWSNLLWSASETVIVSQYPGVKALQVRNEWMVDRADEMLALWDGSWGGTFNCLQYAEKKGVPATNLWHSYRTDLTHILAV